jgi:NAD(P)-dependent dehydrogenase (short-subunit alcohol dehydrogenase family)
MREIGLKNRRSGRPGVSTVVSGRSGEGARGEGGDGGAEVLGEVDAHGPDRGVGLVGGDDARRRAGVGGDGPGDQDDVAAELLGGVAGLREVAPDQVGQDGAVAGGGPLVAEGDVGGDVAFEHGGLGADDAAVRSAIKEAVDAFGRLDVVVNNAGYGDLAAVEDIALDDFKAQIDTNFYGVVHVTKAVLPILREQGAGHLFQVSSIGGRVGSVGLAAYQSAKWAVGGFSTVLAQEVAPLGVKVTVLEPGGMRTDWSGSSMAIPPISDPYLPTVGASAERRRAAAGTEPIDPSKVADVVRDLAGRDDAPLRLVIGADAYALAAATAAAQTASDERWRAVSESVGF